MRRLILRSLLFAGMVASPQGCQHGSTPSVDSLLPRPTVHVDPSVMQECKGVVDVRHRFIPYDKILGLSEPLPGEALAIYHLLDKAGLEGMVSKRRDSKYRSGPSTNWLKTKCYAIDEYELLGVEQEAGKPAFALMADRTTGKYVGSAFINSSRAIRERLWARVQERAGPAPRGMKRPATQWVKPGLIGRVKHLRGEEDLRHASLQDFREE